MPPMISTRWIVAMGLVGGLAACGGAPAATTTTTGNTGGGEGGAYVVPANETPESFDPCAEFTGDLRCGLDTAALDQLLGAPSETEQPEEEGATGEWVMSRKWANAGVSVILSGTTAAGPHTVRGLTIEAPSQLKTVRGIGIGSSLADVRAAYAKAISEDDSNDESIIVGSLYGGLFVTLAGGVVTSMYAGQGAE